MALKVSVYLCCPTNRRHGFAADAERRSVRETHRVAGPLAGIKIVDLTQIVAGPVCTMLLSEQGAEVTKVEFPDGDILRRNLHFVKGGTNALTLNCNRGKQSIAVDMTRAEGVEIVKKLAADADVFVQNFRAGAIERLGITHEELRSINPRLITVWMAGYGQTGPMADVPVFDPVIQAVSGHVAVQVNPQIPFADVHRTIIVDKATALTTAQAITAALFARERSGEGQHIEVNMLDTALYFFWPDGAMANTLLDDDVSSGRTLYEIMSVTECADDKLVYYVANADHVAGLLRSIDRHDLATDNRYLTPEGRADPQNAAVLGEAIAAGFFSLTRDDAIKRLIANDVPVGPVLQLDDIPDYPQVQHNRSLHEWEHPTAGNLRQPRAAAQFSATPNEERWWVPDLNEHGEQILQSIGYDDTQITTLTTTGVVGAATTD